ncbi:MAG: desulfoferrodoxin, partial [Campylobacter sp.]|nr:desulfoferrodoxin [Campylobacter sp.]
MKLNDLYKCSVCGNVVEITHVGGGELVCCSKPMLALVANTEEASTEKHIPVIEKTEKGYLIKVGSVPHPMEEKHYIEFIEVFSQDGKVGRKYLKPGDKPEAEFLSTGVEIIKARIYCNIHGVWESK